MNTMAIAKEKFTVIFNTDGTPCVENDKILVQDNLDQQLYFINLDATLIEDLELEQYFPQQTNIIKKWSNEATSSLIECFKAYEKEYNNNTIKHDVTWSKISTDLNKGGHHFTKNQIKDRWKYLKMRYFKKKDNIRTTGDGTQTFPFYAELDELFGKKPNAEPTALASSAKGYTPVQCNSNEIIQDEKEDCNESEKNSTPKRRKKGPQEALNSTEANRERRHKERLAVQREAIDIYKETMNKLIDKL